jgi:AcrR family transcriptional regulator
MIASPTPSRARSAAYDERLEHVLAAGARVIAREGYGLSSVRQVAREARMSLAGLYHYFSSKEELLFQIQHHTFAAIVDRLEARLDGVSDPRERLRVMVVNHLEHFLERMDELKVCARELDSLRGRLYAEVEELRQQYFHITLEIVEAVGARAGAGPVSTRLATLYLFGMLNWIYMWFPSAAGLTAEDLADQIVGLFLDGYLAGAEEVG